MANLKDHKSSELTKMLLIGDSGTGKTGALAALANKGMKLRILDFDNGLDSLVSALGGPSGKNISNVEYVSLRDGYKAGPVGPILDGMPNTFVNAMRMLTDWDPSKLSGVPADIKTGNKLGSPATWGKDYCLVIDSLTFLGDAAYDQCLAMNPSAKDLRQIYGAAQDGLSNVLSLITHVRYNNEVRVK